MSLLIRPQRSNVPLVSTVAKPAVTPHASPTTEAPDWGRREDEAPESRAARHREAPDAGEGRSHYHEHEFTHGRSQS